MASDRPPSGGFDNDTGRDEVVVEVIAEGGDAACWAHLVCDECGRVTEPGVPHRCGGDDGAPAPTAP